MAININEECFEQHLDDLFKSYGVKGTLVNFFVDESGNYWMLTDDDVLLYRDYAGGKTVEFLKDVSTNGDVRDRLLDIAVVNRQASWSVMIWKHPENYTGNMHWLKSRIGLLPCWLSLGESTCTI